MQNYKFATAKYSANMVNVEKIEQKLGFNKVREWIAARARSSYAKSRAMEEEVSTNPKAIERRLALTQEMKTICMFEPSFPKDGYADNLGYLKPLLKNSTTIAVENMVHLRSYLQTMKEIVNFFNKSKEGAYPCLKELTASIVLYPAIAVKIDNILDRNGNIKDNASPELARIMGEIHSKEGSISRKVQQILSKGIEEGIVAEDATVQMRDGRVLVPVAAGNKRKLGGFVYDESASGKTVFIEPAEVVELNNALRELQFAAQREIQRILLEFSDFLRPYLPELINAAQIIGEVDFILAKGQLAMELECDKPIASQDGELKIVKGRHPVLERALKKENKAIVPLNLSLNSDKSILIISGPNAGGKSVCLKTTGILQYMYQWGMLVSASAISEFPIIDNIFIDIGDEQSIENDLSTYSSHLANMKELVEGVKRNWLVLIDEFGSGTEPAAGGAIAQSILSHLDSVGTYAVITTHYTNLKMYAESMQSSAGSAEVNEDSETAAARKPFKTHVVNGAMLFDAAKIQPLFVLEQGLPGNSFAFELARKIGLPQWLVEQAQAIAGTGFVDMERQLRKISREKRKLEEKLRKISTTDKVLENVTDRYQKELEDIKHTKKEIIEAAKAEAKEIIAGANKEIEATIRKIKEAQAEKERTKEARLKINAFKEDLNKENQSEEDIRIEKKMQQLAQRKARKEARRQKEAQKPAAGNGTAGDSQVETITGPLKVGDRIRIKSNGLIGQVNQISSKYIQVAVGNILSRMKEADIERITAQEFKEAHQERDRSIAVISESIAKRKLEFKPSIDIRGERLSDALDIVSRFIDDAIMLDIPQVKILHGKGTGVLKEEIRKYIRTVPGVTEVNDEDIRYGGSGITVVDFR